MLLAGDVAGPTATSATSSSVSSHPRFTGHNFSSPSVFSLESPRLVGTSASLSAGRRATVAARLMAPPPTCSGFLRKTFTPPGSTTKRGIWPKRWLSLKQIAGGGLALVWSPSGGVPCLAGHGRSGARGALRRLRQFCAPHGADARRRSVASPRRADDAARDHGSRRHRGRLRRELVAERCGSGVGVRLMVWNFNNPAKKWRLTAARAGRSRSRGRPTGGGCVPRPPTTRRLATASPAEIRTSRPAAARRPPQTATSSRAATALRGALRPPHTAVRARARRASPPSPANPRARAAGLVAP